MQIIGFTCDKMKLKIPTCTSIHDSNRQPFFEQTHSIALGSHSSEVCETVTQGVLGPTNRLVGSGERPLFQGRTKEEPLFPTRNRMCLLSCAQSKRGTSLWILYPPTVLYPHVRRYDYLLCIHTRVQMNRFGPKVAAPLNQPFRP